MPREAPSRGILAAVPWRRRASPRVDGSDRARWPASGTMAFVPLLFSLTLLAQSDPFVELRHTMVDDQIKKRGVKQKGVLSALETVPRHLFVPPPNQLEAYVDAPVAFAPGKNLSHAYVSARMIEVLELDGDEKVLEIGTGSGYDAALLSRLAREVYTIEIDHALAAQARETLRKLGFDNVEVKVGDGYRGWPEKAPFDAILVTVSTPKPPPHLYEQLKMGGRMVVAVGTLVQEMQLLTKTPNGPITQPVSLVNLGPMTGEINRQE